MSVKVAKDLQLEHVRLLGRHFMEDQVFDEGDLRGGFVE